MGNHISWDSNLVASLVKIGGRLRSVERSTRFVWQTHWLTHWQTDTQTDFIICPMLLMHWADENVMSNDFFVFSRNVVCGGLCDGDEHPAYAIVWVWRHFMGTFDSGSSVSACYERQTAVTTAMMTTMTTVNVNQSYTSCSCITTALV